MTFEVIVLGTKFYPQFLVIGDIGKGIQRIFREGRVCLYNIAQLYLNGLMAYFKNKKTATNFGH